MGNWFTALIWTIYVPWVEIKQELLRQGWGICNNLGDSVDMVNAYENTFKFECLNNWE